MHTREDIESYLMRSGLPHQEVGRDTDAMWLLEGRASGERIVVRLDGPLVLFRVKVLELSTVAEEPALYAQLLQWNAEDMVHGAYGVSDGNVVLTCTLRIEHLDYSEFQGTLDDFSLALTNHYETLARFRSQA
ncbi:MAG: YbjN domain-containing protein [Myxococcota bacterium]